MRFSNVVAGLALSMSLVAGPASAAPIMSINFTEQSGNVVMSYSGAINLTGIPLKNTGNNFSAGADVEPTTPNVVSLGTGQYGVWGGAAVTANFQPLGSLFTFTTTSGMQGDTLGFTPDSDGYSMLLPKDYVSLTSLSGTATFNSKTISTMGLTPGSYTWTFGSNEVGVTVAGVPEPSTYVMALAGMAYGGYSMWPRRKQTSRERKHSWLNDL